MSNPFGSPFGDDPMKFLRDAMQKAEAKPVTTDKPLPQIRGKRIDGTLYVRADDVADALESQAPSACKRLIDKLRRTA